MAMSICESFQSTALAGLGIRLPHWAVPQFSKPPRQLMGLPVLGIAQGASPIRRSPRKSPASPEIRDPNSTPWIRGYF